MSSDSFAFDTAAMDFSQDSQYSSRRSSQQKSYSQPRTTMFPASAIHANSPEVQALQMNELSISQGHNYTTGPQGFSFDFDQFVHTEPHSSQNDTSSPATSQMDGSQIYTGMETWPLPLFEDFRTTSLDGHYQTSLTQSPPISPLTDLSSDFTSASSCSESNYAFAQDESFFANQLSPGMISQFASVEDFNNQWTLFPAVLPLPNGFQDFSQPMTTSPVLTARSEESETSTCPPLMPSGDHEDAQRTIRASKQSSRPLLSAVSSRTSSSSGSDSNNSSPVGETTRQRGKDSGKQGQSRTHPHYSRGPSKDGLYHCPYEHEGCQHPATRQKCGYDKFIDSHLKPFRCKMDGCAESQFSSAACRLRHEREAHGMHGHGERPYMCKFEGCDRAGYGNGFPRRWNLNDHMKRVHDYTDPENSPGSSPGSQNGDKKTTIRRRKEPGATLSSQAMKKTRSTQSNSSTSSKVVKNRQGELSKGFNSAYSRLQQVFAEPDHKRPEWQAKVNAAVQVMNSYTMKSANSDVDHNASPAVLDDGFCAKREQVDPLFDSWLNQ